MFRKNQNLGLAQLHPLVAVSLVTTPIGNSGPQENSSHMEWTSMESLLSKFLGRYILGYIVCVVRGALLLKTE